MTAHIRVAHLAASLVLMGLLLAACVPTSENPILSKAGASGADLIGSWRGKMQDGAAVHMHFLKTKAGGITALLVTTEGEKGKDDDGWAAFSIVTAKVKGTRYISALWLFDDGKPVEGREKGYHLMRYVLDGERLQLYGVNEDKLIAAVKSGKVEGKIEGEGTAAEVRLTASSHKLARFLRRADPADLFDKPFAALSKEPM
jgi:hypothetical protein